MDKYQQFIKERGMPLKETLGVNEVAFNRNDALSLLEIMKELKMPVLGGDVIIVDDQGAVSYTHDNWHYDRISNDTHEAYVINSIAKAEGYIRQFPEQTGAKYYYVVV